VHWLFQVTAKEDSRVPPLAEVKERIVASLREEKRMEAARAAAAKVLAAAKTAAELEKGARAAGAAVTALPPFTAASGKLPPSLEGAAKAREEIARLTLRSPVMSRPVEAGKRWLALALASEELPSADEWAADRDAFRKKAQERKREELVSSFVAERRAAAKVTINQEALK
jgi:peptidyl-prolyl cis-trans isomerase D